MTTTENTPIETTQETPKEIYIRHAQAYPYTDEIVSLRLIYNDGIPAPNGEMFKPGEFLIRRADAEALAKGLSVILTAPNTKAAWDTISASIEEHDPEFSDDDVQPDARILAQIAAAEGASK